LLLLRGMVIIVLTSIGRTHPTRTNDTAQARLRHVGQNELTLSRKCACTSALAIFLHHILSDPLPRDGGSRELQRHTDSCAAAFLCDPPWLLKIVIVSSTWRSSPSRSVKAAHSFRTFPVRRPQIDTLGRFRSDAKVL